MQSIVNHENVININNYIDFFLMIVNKLITVLS